MDIELAEEDRELLPGEMLRKNNIQVELYNLNVEEETYWYQRSHAQWLLLGDQNTSHFHKIANGRKRKNTVHSLDDQGVLVEGTDNLLKHATSYYKELFGPAPGNMFDISPELWGPSEMINVEDNEDLTRPFSC